MLASQGSNNESIHKKTLGPNSEIHEAHRQVLIYAIFQDIVLMERECISILISN